MYPIGQKAQGIIQSSIRFRINSNSITIEYSLNIDIKKIKYGLLNIRINKIVLKSVEYDLFQKLIAKTELTFKLDESMLNQEELQVLYNQILHLTKNFVHKH
jgi:hypothetical protein